MSAELWKKQRVRERRQGDRGGGAIRKDAAVAAGEARVFFSAAEVMSDSEGSLRRRREHHRANMWLWFNAGLASVAAPPRLCLRFSRSLCPALYRVQRVCFPYTPIFIEVGRCHSLPKSQDFSMYRYTVICLEGLRYCCCLLVKQNFVIV